jgi:hypothetical protein
VNSFDVCVTVTLGKQQRPVLDDRDRRARGRLGVQLDGHRAIDELGQLGRRKRLRARLRLGSRAGNRLIFDACGGSERDARQHESQRRFRDSMQHLEGLSGASGAQRYW